MFELKNRTKKKRRYVIIKQIFKNEENETYKTYGVRLKNENLIIDDVSSSKKVVKKIIYNLNKYQADPLQLTDIIIDALP